MKEIMGDNDYDNYKATMAVYLAPNNLHIHERFCCAYCERVFPDQWILEKVKFSLSACPRKVTWTSRFSLLKRRIYFSIYIRLNINRIKYLQLKKIIKNLLLYVILIFGFRFSSFSSFSVLLMLLFCLIYINSTV